ncbi:MAG: AsmA-like C-terminal region-containing protein [Prolixibacteraceae bacterium]|jgi:hypothetical protein|nr:AsmA-like C-terminal region-containing protein [Prolixibacteraceae bacterium]
MKRILYIILFVFVGLIGVMAVAPLFFKNSISLQLKTEINKHIEGTVDFERFHISLFNKFPKVEIQMVGLSIAGTGNFRNDTLVSANEISGTITLAGLLKRKELKITRLNIVGADILLKTIEGGYANWDIVPVGETGTAVADSTENGIVVMLDDLQLSGLNLTYVDVPSGMLFLLKNSSAQSEGEIAGNRMNFDIEAQSEEMVFEYDSVKYISNTKVRATSKMLFDSEKTNFIFSEGKVWLNDLQLDVDGSFSIPSDSMYFDLNLTNNSKDFKALLNMVPADYKPYLEKVQAEGTAIITGSFKGWYHEENYPAFRLAVEIADGIFKYTDLPEKIEQINLGAVISKPQGGFDDLVADVSKASASLRGMPVNMQLKITTPVSDPVYVARLQGEIDFNVLNKTIPMEGVDLQGKLNADLALEGRQSDIGNSAYDRFKSNGRIILDHFVYRSEALKQPLNIQSGVVQFTTPKVEVKSLNGNIGQSHFSMSGYLTDYLPYFLKNGTLRGDFTLNSDFINLTELAAIRLPQIEKEPGPAVVQPSVPATDSILAFHVPGRMDMKFRSAIKQAVFDRMEMKQISGLIAIHDQTLELTNLDMEMLQGKLTVNGSYTGNEQMQPDFDFKLNVENFDVQSAYQSLNMIRRYLPIAARSQGKISTRFSLKGKMNEKLELISSSLDGSGLFNTQQLMVVDNPTFSQLKGIIKSEKLKNVRVDDFTARFSVDKGNLEVNPFKTRIADQEATIQGTVSVKSELDFLLGFKLNRADLGDDINKGLGFVPGSQNIQQVDVGVKITGPVKDPNVSVDLDAARKQIMDEVKKAGAQEIQEKVKKIGDELKKLFK